MNYEAKRPGVTEGPGSAFQKVSGLRVQPVELVDLAEVNRVADELGAPQNALG